jgi:glutathione peroxidase
MREREEGHRQFLARLAPAYTLLVGAGLVFGGLRTDRRGRCLDAMGLDRRGPCLDRRRRIRRNPNAEADGDDPKSHGQCAERVDQLAGHGQLLCLLTGVVCNYNTKTHPVKSWHNPFNPTEVILRATLREVFMSNEFRNILFLMIFIVFGAHAGGAYGPLLDHSYRPLAGKTQVSLAKAYKGQVLLVVNTASKCGYTPQFEALEAMHARLKSRGFAVLGFPSGDFKEQEFSDENQIQEFCTLTYGVKFPMFQKVHVVGEQATPLYRALADATGQPPKWNFHKYVIGRDGRVVASFGSAVKPDAPELMSAIEKALARPAPKR